MRNTFLGRNPLFWVTVALVFSMFASAPPLQSQNILRNGKFNDLNLSRVTDICPKSFTGAHDLYPIFSVATGASGSK